MSPLKVNELQALNEGIKVHSNFRTLIRYKKLKQNGDCMYKTGKINLYYKQKPGQCNEFSPFPLTSAWSASSLSRFSFSSNSFSA